MVATTHRTAFKAGSILTTRGNRGGDLPERGVGGKVDIRLSRNATALKGNFQKTVWHERRGGGGGGACQGPTNATRNNTVGEQILHVLKSHWVALRRSH